MQYRSYNIEKSEVAICALDFIVILVLLIGLSAFGYHFIEEPLRHKIKNI